MAATAKAPPPPSLGRRLRYRLEYGLYLGFRAALACLPHAGALALGRGFGALVYRLKGSERRRALSNLGCALPELDLAQRERLALASFRQVGQSVIDTLASLRFSTEDLEQRLEVEGWEHVEAAHRRGRGVFILSAHLGAWEVPAYVVALRQGPLHLVSNTMKNPLFDRELRRLRALRGLEIIEKKGAARRMYRVLTAGGKVGIALDQRVAGEEAIAVPFFGRDSLTSPLPAYLSLWTGAAVVPTFGFAHQGRYKVVFQPALLPPEDAELEPEAIAALTRRYLEVIEAEILRHPDQWIWMYRRWRDSDDAASARSSLVTGVGLPPVRRRVAEEASEGR